MSAATWNLVIYAIAGDAAEHQAVLHAIDDMRAALTTDQCHIAVQVMAKGQTTRYWISSQDKDHTEVLPDVVDASHQASLTGFLNLAARRLPAGATALTLWAHGSGLDHLHDYRKKPGGPGGGGLGGAPTEQPHGLLATDQAARLRTPYGRALSPRGRLTAWLPRHPGYGCRWGPDPNTGRFLTNVTMKKAIAASLGGHVDLLAINACWMATLEVEYELRDAAPAIVASQVYAKPWPYRAIVEALSRRPVQTAEQLAQTIVAAISAEIAAGQRDDAVSAFRAGAALDDLAAAFDAYAELATHLIDTDWQAVHDAVMTGVQRLDDPYQADLVSLVKRLGKHDHHAHAAGEAVAQQLEAMRIGHAAHPQHPGLHGLSIFCPRSTEVDLADAYAGTEFRTNAWSGFLAKFQPRLAAS
ncbi:MAG TPA: clostripain-related cysteine peptidase [Kofleriaceae bacterium]|jgi:hypothetical protein|nr:clostripain-related cysteine peptidase [Kofleriaceae bacterium]